jgi:hypothetical protein
MKYVVTDKKPFSPVIFINNKTTHLKTGRRLRFLLHGSARHMEITSTNTYPIDEVSRGLDGSNIASFYSFIHSLLEREINPLSIQTLSQKNECIPMVLSDLDYFVFDESHKYEWVAGYARVTSVSFNRDNSEVDIVTATPLFVERTKLG